KIERPDLLFQMTYVGIETLDIGGQKLQAHHVIQTSSWTSAVSGSLKREVWYTVDTGLMVKLTIKSLGEGIISMESDTQYELTSLTPQQ
ncbi:hypothetical protein KJ865_12920, partial [Myxococcota bacterium]|nr:hypothetical protein [Myxococcota bacterium]